VRIDMLGGTVCRRVRVSVHGMRLRVWQCRVVWIG
jgi:hypothetical protein